MLIFFQLPIGPKRFANTSGPKDYDGLDLYCFEVTKPPHKNMKDNNIEVVKLDHCNQVLQQFHTASLD